MTARCPTCDGPTVIRDERVVIDHESWCHRHPHRMPQPPTTTPDQTHPKGDPPMPNPTAALAALADRVEQLENEQRLIFDVLERLVFDELTHSKEKHS